METPSQRPPIHVHAKNSDEAVGASSSEGSGTSEQRRRELADFLRTRREKLKPEQVGIAQGSRRRTPGLRREEVAELAGVGTTWYTWLEQARDIQPSSEVLRRLGTALQMTPAEVRHLFSLAGKAAPFDIDTTETPSESLKRFMETSLQVPAVLLGARWDVLCMNKHAQNMFPSLAATAEGERNWIRFIFCNDVTKSKITGWEDHARRLLAEFRANVSDSLDSP